MKIQGFGPQKIEKTKVAVGYLGAALLAIFCPADNNEEGQTNTHMLRFPVSHSTAAAQVGPGAGRVRAPCPCHTPWSQSPV